MGMLSRAMKKRKDEMLKELDTEKEMSQQLQREVKKVITVPNDLAEVLSEMSSLRGIDVEQLVIVHMTSVVNAYKNSKIMRLTDTMPYGKYRGVLVEDVIRSDPRYTNWLASTSNIFVLDEEATELLKELS